MKLADYIMGRRLRLISPLGPDAVQHSINVNTRSGFWPFGKGVVGWARFGRIYLRYRRGFFDFDAKPALTGRIEDDLGRSIIELRYRSPIKIYFYLALWLLILTIFWDIVRQDLALGRTSGSIYIELVLFVLYVLLPAGVYWLSTMDADEELARLLEFLHANAGTTPLPD